ncbi:MAG: hypothetical protein U0934_06185 [Pseudotabrizicola sp.]|uniref:hypothetical protein n=1 Tax=Pseudotabrizicola sp. TaxID=2939647 RepID=UPI0027320ACC|nr:hypothetical protein [Pseudotabrizicola sp.]MDP2082630.1 hypothetical protein [Pseudotabrizicola sp.]MDZ7573526.1 hypothetical protein [Pseudotabrizicola sp.]
MLVFWEQRLVILATPKTGSTAIESALDSLAAVSIQRPPALKHTNVTRFRRFVGPYLDSAAGEPFTVVALMREPRDWLGSWYRYRSREDISEAAKSTQGMDFDTFVQAWCHTPRPAFAKVGSQARFLKGPEGRGADRVFRYENIDSFIDFLEDRLDFQIILPQLNVSPKAAMDLSPETLATLREVAAEDFALYESLR